MGILSKYGGKKNFYLCRDRDALSALDRHPASTELESRQ